MRRFLYYLPGLSGCNPRLLAERGLIDRFTRGMGIASGLIEHCITGVNDGPAGSGVIVAPGAQPPDELFTHRIDGGTPWTEFQNFWLAFEDMPGPDDLLRPLGIRGYELELADGHTWSVPLIHKWDPAKLMHTPNLPRSMAPRLDPHGGKYLMQNKVRAEYQGVDGLAEKIFAGFVAGESLTAEQAFEYSAKVLAVNYRIGMEEAGLLGIFDETRMVQALGTCIDYYAMRKQAEIELTAGIVEQEPGGQENG
jgi:hypothetical protein